MVGPETVIIFTAAITFTYRCHSQTKTVVIQYSEEGEAGLSSHSLSLEAAVAAMKSSFGPSGIWAIVSE